MLEFSRMCALFREAERRQIWAMLNTPRAPVPCPRCAEAMILIGPIIQFDATSPTFEVLCAACHRVAVVTDVPGIPPITPPYSRRLGSRATFKRLAYKLGRLREKRP